MRGSGSYSSSGFLRGGLLGAIVRGRVFGGIRASLRGSLPRASSSGFLRGGLLGAIVRGCGVLRGRVFGGILRGRVLGGIRASIRGSPPSPSPSPWQPSPRQSPSP